MMKLRIVTGLSLLLLVISIVVNLHLYTRSKQFENIDVRVSQGPGITTIESVITRGGIQVNHGCKVTITPDKLPSLRVKVYNQGRWTSSQRYGIGSNSNSFSDDFIETEPVVTQPKNPKDKARGQSDQLNDAR